MKSMIPEIEVPGVGVVCIFTAEVIDYNEDVVFSTGPFHNEVLDCGLLDLNTYILKDMTVWANVGTATDDPNPSQTGLINRLYSTNAIFNSQEGAYYSQYPTFRGYKRTIQFAPGSCTGDFTEVGLSRASNSGYFNRQRFKNASGYNIIVRVASDQGLRLTCDLRIYPDPDFKPYSQIYSLDLKGATAGNITFTNGTTKTLTYDQMTNVGTFKSQLETWLGIGSICNVALLSDSKYYIFAHPLNGADLGISIDSHTLTGGTGVPTVTVNQPYISCLQDDSFVFDDVTGGITPTKNTKCHWVASIANMDKYTMKLAAASTIQYNGWCEIENTTLPAICIGSLGARALTQTGTMPTPTFIAGVSGPTVADMSWVKRVYYAPGDLGTGTQVVTAFVIYNATSNALPCVCVVKLDSPITVAAGEEFEFNFKFKWGRT